MPRQSNSNYQAPANTSAISHAQISSTAFNTLEADIGAEITNSLDRLGRGAMQANLPMGGFRITGQGAGSATSDGAVVSQVQSDVLSQAVSVSGVDTIVLTFAPQFVGPLVAGTKIRWASAGSNATTSPTVNVDTIGVVNLIRNGGASLAIGDTGASGYECEAEYNGTNWLLLNPASSAYGPLASAATTDLGTIATRNVQVTGTIPITSFGSSASTSQPVYNLVFSGITTITLSANITAQGMASGAVIKTAANDTALLIYLGSGVWQIANYASFALTLRPRPKIVLTAGTSWVATATIAYVEVVGGGGGSAGSAGNATPSGGGAGGGYAAKLYSGLVIGNSYSYAIGAAGAAGAATPTFGGTGGNTTFTDGTTVITGNGGSGSAIGIAGAASGGTGTNGDVNITGQRGAPCTASASAPTGGSSYLGLGGAGGQVGAQGFAGGSYGGGAGGSSGTSVAGSAGAAGAVIITPYN